MVRAQPELAVSAVFPPRAARSGHCVVVCVLPYVFTGVSLGMEDTPPAPLLEEGEDSLWSQIGIDECTES